jgi:hypothetical protein
MNKLCCNEIHVVYFKWKPLILDLQTESNPQLLLLTLLPQPSSSHTVAAFSPFAPSTGWPTEPHIHSMDPFELPRT